MPNPKRDHISAIRESHPEAFAAYVELLVEDCTDTFEVNDDGVFATFHDHDGPGPVMKWDEETKSWEQQD